jgi:hypothetical protein
LAVFARLLLLALLRLCRRTPPDIAAFEARAAADLALAAADLALAAAARACFAAERALLAWFLLAFLARILLAFIAFIPFIIIYTKKKKFKNQEI